MRSILLCSLPIGARLPALFGLVLTLVLSLSLLVPAPAKAGYADIVIDAATGEVLRSRSADAHNYPASLTKMMTLYMLFEALEAGQLQLDSKLAVSAQAAKQPATKLGLPKGGSIPVEKAILALVIQSANDVATVVAEAIGGSEAEFAKMMTAQARELGMTETIFKNASGLPNNGQITTARDMAKLATALIYDFPEYYHYFGALKFSYNGRTYESHNRLMMRYEGADGLKTGYIRASGFNLATSAVRDGRRLIAVVMGGKTAASRDKQMEEILDKAFVLAQKLPPVSDPLATQMAVILPPQKPAALGGVPQIATDATQPLSLPADFVASLTIAPAVAPAGEAGQGDSAALAASDPAGLATTPAVATATSTGETHVWGIQVGAFGSQDPARNAASAAHEKLSSLIGPAQIEIHQTPGQNGPLYRAQLVGMTREQAEQACYSLKQADDACLVIKSGVVVALSVP